MFAALVAEFVRGQFSSLIAGVRLSDVKVSDLIAQNVRAYGDQLTTLTDEAWDSSRYRWMDGYWQVLLDLSTDRENVSDLVLHARIRDEPALHIIVDGVWVP